MVSRGRGHNFWPSDGWAPGCNLRERGEEGWITMSDLPEVGKR